MSKQIEMMAFKLAWAEMKARAERGRPTRPNAWRPAACRIDTNGDFTEQNIGITTKIYADLVEGLGYEHEDVESFVRRYASGLGCTRVAAIGNSTIE